MKKLLFLFCAAAMFCACAMKDSRFDGDVVAPEGDEGYWADGEGGAGGGEGNGEGNGQSSAGKVTAAEWRDLDNWLFWSQLMTAPLQDSLGSVDYTGHSAYWGFYTNNRVAVRVRDAANVPQRDVPVQIKNGDAILYEGRTDNHGETNLFIGLLQKQENVDASALTLVVNGAAVDQTVLVTKWGEEPKWNECTASVTATRDIDIAFIVDATGSMMDEIRFLKDDLLDIISKVSTGHADANIRTAALFYRDEGDDYLTRVSDFSTSISTTSSFISQQSADGGGDYPEAVHTALATGLQSLSWREGNSIRLAFMLLDAPPHHEDNVLASLHQTVPQYAKKGIRIIPVAASGVDKQTEFFLRFTAIATDATYVFITNDSGIGLDHIAATVGDHQIELLNDLIVRLVNRYLE